MRRSYKLFVLLILSLVLIIGCSQKQESKIKGGTEEEKLEEEPTIKVELEDGEVKTMKLEEYVQGVVAGEMKKDWPENAYGAQAIKARTFVLRRIEDTADNTISADHEEAQAYKPANITDAIKSAVDKTRGKVVTYKGEYIKAWFHSSAGGETTTAKVGLNYKKAEPKYIKSVQSPDGEAPADIKDWQFTLTKEDLIGILEDKNINVTEINGVKIKEDDPTGRIVELEIEHDQGSTEMHGADFRKAVGPDKLKSTKIETIKEENNNFVFTGKGYGHGVGMSQWGAYKLAKEGKTPTEIISYYYKDVKVEKIY